MPRGIWVVFLAATLLLTTATRADEPTILRGRVLLADDMPAIGVDLYWPRAGSPPPKTLKEVEYQKRGVSDAEGRFEIALSKDDMPVTGLAPFVVAHQEGFGIDWFKIEKGEVPAEITLRLIEDRPVRGRVIDTEGRPVAGARLAVKSISASREGSLDIFLTAFERSWHDAWPKLDRRVPFDAVLTSVSDRDGRFELSGVGVERLALVEIVAAGRAADELYVVNRPGFDADKYNGIIQEFETPFAREMELFPSLASPNWDYIAEAELVIRGKVFTGPDQAPVSGAVVHSYGRGQGQMLTATSDERGRYELHGVPRNRKWPVSAAPPASSGFLPGSVTLGGAPGQFAVDVDLELKRGVFVEGRLFDQATGQGVTGSVSYIPLPDNEFARQPGFDHFLHSRVGQTTDEEGRFRLMIIPGPGVLMGNSGRTARVGEHAIDPYRQATFSEADRQRVLPKEDDDDRYFALADGAVQSLGLGNSVKVVNPPLGSNPVTCDLPLDPGKTIELSIEDAEGVPVSDAIVSGLGDCWRFTFRIAEPTCTIYGLGADRPRRVCILHPQRALAASLTLTGEEAGPVTARLGAAATITGRALEANGEPIADAFVVVNYARLSARELDRFLELEHPAIKTDGEGRFEVSSIVPGERFALDFRQDKSYFRANLSDEQRQLQTGQKLELGDTRLKQLR